MDVAVVGGGIGGLSLALQLERAGIRCRVYESVADYPPSVWASTCFPHAVRRLHHLGLADALRPVAVQEQEFAFFTRHGQRVYFEPSGRSAGYDVAHACGTTGRPSRGRGPFRAAASGRACSSLALAPAAPQNAVCDGAD